MAISINWGTKVITVPQADLDHISGTLYELDTDTFRLALKALEESEEGMPFLDTHRHNTEVTVAGITYARTLEIINGYTITFEDGQYTVRLAGSNNNFFDVENGVLNQNQVQIISTNSAGLQVVVQGSGVTQQDKDDIIDGVWDEMAADHTDSGTTGEALQQGGGGATLSEIEGSTVLAKQADLLRILGLVQENQRIDQMVYDGSGHLTSGRIRIYDSDPDSSGAAVIATYQITATWAADQLTEYKVARQ